VTRQTSQYAKFGWERMQCRFKHVLTMLDPATATQAVKLILDRGLDAWVYNATPQIFRALLAAGHHDVVGHLGSIGQRRKSRFLDAEIWTNTSLRPPPSGWMKP
jgi:hypothetical protein